MLNERKSWSNIEDSILIQLYNQYKEKFFNQQISWNFIAQRLNQLKSGSNRSGKQCRQRWFNQLEPHINRNIEWTEQDKLKLIELHQRYGNHWSVISKNFQGRTDNSIKNFMNSSLRKGLRLLSIYISKNRKFKQFKFRNIKQYKAQILSKILAFSGNSSCLEKNQDEYCFSTFEQNKQQTFLKVYQLTSTLKKQLMFLQSHYLKEGINLTQRKVYSPVSLFENLIVNIQKLNTLCKKRKQKKQINKRIKIKKNCLKTQWENKEDFKFNSGSFQIQKVNNKILDKNTLKQQQKIFNQALKKSYNQSTTVSIKDELIVKSKIIHNDRLIFLQSLQISDEKTESILKQTQFIESKNAAVNLKSQLQLSTKQLHSKQRQISLNLYTNRHSQKIQPQYQDQNKYIKTMIKLEDKITIQIQNQLDQESQEENYNQENQNYLIYHDQFMDQEEDQGFYMYQQYIQNQQNSSLQNIPQFKKQK